MLTSRTPRIAAAVALIGAAVAGCGSSTSSPVTPSSKIEQVAGDPAGMIVLTAQGANRIGLQTARVRSVPPPPPAPPPAKVVGHTTAHAGTATTTPAHPKPAAAPAAPTGPTVTIPLSGVVYAPTGSTYAFTSPGPLTYREVPITIDHITGSTVYLLKGPRAGTTVVTVGAEELFGVQTGVLAQT